MMHVSNGIFLEVHFCWLAGAVKLGLEGVICGRGADWQELQTRKLAWVWPWNWEKE
jgi:hypothetical protein